MSFSTNFPDSDPLAELNFIQTIPVIGPEIAAGITQAGRIAFGTAAAGSITQTQTQEQFKRDLDRNSDVTVKTKVAEPGTKVVKFDDVIFCVESVTKTRYAASFIESVRRQFFGGDNESGAQILAQEIIDCVEEKLLSQSSGRKKETVTYNKRDG